MLTFLWWLDVLSFGGQKRKRRVGRLDVVSCGPERDSETGLPLVTRDGRGRPVLEYKRVLYGDGRERLIPVVLDVDYGVSLFTPSEQKVLTPWIRPLLFSPTPVDARLDPRSMPALDPVPDTRVFSQELDKAYSLACSEFSPEVLAEQIRLAEDYCRAKGRLVVVLIDPDSGDVIAVPYRFRWAPNRVSEVKRFFRDVVGPNLSKYGWFLLVTFTLDPKRFKSQKEAKDYALSQFNRVWTAVKRRYGSKVDLAMIRVTEWQGNGIGVHLHVLICGMRFIPLKWLRALWGEPNGRAVNVKSLGRDYRAALNYILKYIVRAALRPDGSIVLNPSQVVNWATRSRSYGISRCLTRRNFSLVSMRNSNGFWVFLGVVDLETYNSLCVCELLALFGRGVT